MANASSNGSIRYIVFREAGIWYAVALELNLVDSGNDPREALLLLMENIRGYVQTALKNNAPSSTLNQVVDPEYERLWHDVEQQKQRHEMSADVFSYGQQGIPALVGAV